MATTAELSAERPSPISTGVLVVRPGRRADVDGLYRLALAAGSGMTNLQPDHDLLRDRLKDSEAAMLSADFRARGAPMFLVVERLDPGGGPTDGTLVATACIFSRIGVEWPFHSYRLTRQAQTHKALGKVVAHDVLILANDFDGATEVGGLFVDATARGAAAGRLTARSRYLFLAEHRDWFGRQVISDMRGYQDENGVSPVWEALGREFYEMDFAEADRMNAVLGNQFIADLSPKHPIYASLLPKAARRALGRPHDDGRRAMALLLEEGFRSEGYIDIFDGGPTLFADIDDLRAVRDSRRATVLAIDETDPGPDRLVSTGAGAAFRCARGGVAAIAGGLTVDTALAHALGLKIGDTVRHVEF
jgi:arginine N-succinyltransferase